MCASSSSAWLTSSKRTIPFQLQLMSEDRDLLLSDLLHRLRLTPEEYRAFSRTDTEATLIKVHLLTAAAVYFNTQAVREFGGRAGAARSRGLVEQVIGAAFQTYADVDPHPGPFDKATMLWRGITQGHPFNDGNKRTGFLLAAYYLDLTGHPFPATFPFDDALALSIGLSSGTLRDLTVIAREVEWMWRGIRLE